MTAEDFDEFWRQNYDPVVRSLTIAFGDAHLAEDCAQVGFERALRKWRTVSAMERPGTWVYVVAVRRGRRQLDRDKRRPGDLSGLSGQPVRDDGDPQGTVTDAVVVAELLGGLTDRQRVIVVLRHLAALPLAEIASALGISTGTVKSTLHDAYTRMRVGAVTDGPALQERPGAGDGVASNREEPTHGNR